MEKNENVTKEKLKKKWHDKSSGKTGEIRAIPQYYGPCLASFFPLSGETEKSLDKCILYIYGEKKNGLREVMKYTILGPWNSMHGLRKMKASYNEAIELKKSVTKEDILKQAIEKDDGGLSDDINTILVDSLKIDLTKQAENKNGLSHMFGSKNLTNCKVVSKIVATYSEMDAAIQSLLEKLQCPCGKFVEGLENGQSIACFSSERKYCSFSCQNLFDKSRTFS